MRTYAENVGRVIFALGLLFIGFRAILLAALTTLPTQISIWALFFEFYCFLFLFYLLRWRLLLIGLLLFLTYNAFSYSYISGYSQISPHMFYHIPIEICWILVLIRLGMIYQDATRAFFFLSAIFKTVFRTAIVVMIVFSYYQMAFGPFLIGIAAFGYVAEFIAFALLVFLPRKELQAPS